MDSVNTRLETLIKNKRFGYSVKEKQIGKKDLINEGKPIDINIDIDKEDLKDNKNIDVDIVLDKDEGTVEIEDNEDIDIGDEEDIFDDEEKTNEAELLLSNRFKELVNLNNAFFEALENVDVSLIPDVDSSVVLKLKKVLDNHKEKVNFYISNRFNKTDYEKNQLFYVMFREELERLKELFDFFNNIEIKE